MEARRADVTSKLYVQWRSEILSLGLDAEAPLVLGRGAHGLRVDGDYVSRRHARIEADEHHFVLIDESTNGTFVQTEDRKLTFVRRDRVRLWGEGWISLGEPPCADNAIRFGHLE